MPASRPHRRLSPVRACVLLIVVYLGVCALLFAEEKPPVPSQWSRLFPTLFGEEKTSVEEAKPPVSSEWRRLAPTLFGEKKLPARREWNHSVAPVDDIRVRKQRTQRTQRPGGDDRFQAFYDSVSPMNTFHAAQDRAGGLFCPPRWREADAEDD